MRANLTHALLSFIFLLQLSSCTEDEALPKRARIQIAPHGSNDHYAGFPVFISAVDDDLSFIKGSYNWDFGDGTTSDLGHITHTYANAGEYIISVKINLSGGRNISLKDTLQLFHLPIVGDPLKDDNALNILETTDHKYVILTGPCPSLPSHTSQLFTLSKSYELLSQKILYEDGPNVNATLGVDKDRFALLTVDGHFIIHDIDGAKVVDKILPLGMNMKQIESDIDGYYLAGDSLYGKYATVSYLNNAGEKIWSKSLLAENSKEGYYLNRFKAPNTFLRFFIPKITNIENPEQPALLMQSITGQVVSEAEMSFFNATEFFPLPSGFVVSGQNTENEFYDVFGKFDDSGQEKWWFLAGPTFDLFGNVTNARPCIFEKDDFTYIFYGNMMGAKLDSQGKIVWKKRFTFPNDIFRAAIINESGNFVLLGDIVYPSEPDSYPPNDVVMVEVNQQGQIVN